MPFNRPIPDPKSRGKIAGGVAIWAQAEKLMQIALVLPCAAIIGWLAGGWLDIHLHQKWIGLAGIVFGGISGLVYVVRLAVATGNESEKNGDGASTGKGSAGTPS
jgi:hypothetical protein